MQGTAYVKQMAQDWEKQPFIDLKVVDVLMNTGGQGSSSLTMDHGTSFDCPKGWEEAYQNVWGGQHSGCDCLGICGVHMNGCYEMHID